MELINLLEILWRRKRVAISIFAVVFFTILIGSLLITPWYDAKAKIILRKSTAEKSLFSSIGLTGSTSSQGEIITETEVSDYLALSTVKPVAEKVVSELNLKRDRIRAKLMRSIPFLKPLLKLFGVDVTATDEPMRSEQLMVSSFFSYIFPRPYVEISQFSSTAILEIEAVSPDPQQAMMIANTMAEVIIEEERIRFKKDFKNTKKYIDDGIQKARIDYIKSLQEFRKFKEKEKTVNLDTETQNLLAILSDLKRSFENNKLEISKLDASIKQIEFNLKSMPKFQKASETLKDNEMISSLKNTLRELYIDLAETKTKYETNHFYVIDIQNKIDQAKELLQQEVKKVFSQETISIDYLYKNLTEKMAQYYTDISGYENQNKVLPKIIKKYESELLHLPGKTAKYTQLELSLNVAQDIFNTLYKYQYRVGLAESMALSNINIVQPATMPEKNISSHKHPDVLLNTAVAILLGVIFGMGTAFLLEYVDNTIRTPDDVKAFNKLTFLGSIYKLKEEESMLVDSAGQGLPLMEAFRTICNNIKFATGSSQTRSFAVTSSISGEGKTFSVANMAISIANTGKNVLIIDGNLRKPAVHTYFNLQNNLGLSDFLEKDVSVKSIQLSSGKENLNIIPSGPIPAEPAKMVESDKLRKLLENVREHYDLVIVDTPPILSISDSIILGSLTDGVIVIIESEKTNKNIFSKKIEWLKKANLKIIGTVLNKTSERDAFSYF